MDDYLPILVLLILAFLFAALSFVGSALMAPKRRPTSAKVAPYECGMIFIIFDIEIVFLYPWAVDFRQLRTFGLVEIIVFAAAVFISFLFLVSNGALTWGPARTLVRAMPQRTSESTIARISGEPAVASAIPGAADPEKEPAVGAPGSPTGPGRAA